MNYWRGLMDWPLDVNWRCETCGINAGLEWGFVHAQRRCNQCHTQYTMRADDKERTVVTCPISMLREEYKVPARLAFARYQKPIDQLSDSEWEAVKE